MSEQIFDCAQGVGTCLKCGKNFECGATPFLNRVKRLYMSRQEVYHSSTLGPIPLSFTGRRLMQNLREAFQELLQKRERAMNDRLCTSPKDWTPVSEARGRLAKYISQLEGREQINPELVNLRHENEVLRKANEAYKLREQRQGRKVRADSELAYLHHRGEIPFWQFPATNEYLVRVIEGNFKANKRVERKPGSIITTELTLGGSMNVVAVTMDDALDLAVKCAHDNGFTELTRKDFDVRLVSVPEA